MRFTSWSSLAAAAAVLVSTTEARPQEGGSSSSTACNNSPSLCDRAYNEVTFLGGHNSAFLRDESTGNSLSGNQYYNATRALNAGLRLLQAQVHRGNESLVLCHSSCSLLDAGPLEDWLSAINYWMGQNTHDVVTVLLVNAADATADEYAEVFTASGLADIAYRPESFQASAEWPTLQTMIDDDRRLVSFVTEVTHSETAPFILDEFSHVFETPFEVTDLGGFNCTLDRPLNQDTAANALANGFLGLVNHFKYQQLTASIQLPDVDSIDIVNDPGTSAPGNIGRHLESCNADWNTRPNFVLVDFFSEGDPLAAVDRINDISDASGRTAIEDLGDDDSSAAGGALKGREFGALLAFFSAALLLV